MPRVKIFTGSAAGKEGEMIEVGVVIKEVREIEPKIKAFIWATPSNLEVELRIFEEEMISVWDR